MAEHFAFGPFRYALELPPGLVVPAEWEPFRTVSGGSPVRVALADAAPFTLSPGERRGSTFRLWRGDDRTYGEIFPYTQGSPLPRWSLGELLAACLLLDADAAQALVLHAAAVRAVSGTSAWLCIAAPGTGKSTLGRGAGERVVAYNAVVLDAAGTVWPLPFCGGEPDPVVPSREGLALEAIALLRRSERPSVERARPLAATKELMSALAVPSGWSHPRARVERLLALASGARIVELGLGPAGEARACLAALAAVEQRT